MSNPSPPSTTPPRGLARLWAWGPVVWLATGSWFGLSPVMPGTVGAIWGIPLAMGIGQIPQPGVQLVVIGLLALASVPVCTIAAQRLGLKDPGSVVLDEIVSLPVTFFLHPVNDPAVLAVGFFLHRVFDILKPPPVRQAERLPAGWGIVADDLVAGAYSNLALWLVTGLGLFSWWHR